MATLEVQDQTLVLTLSLREKLGGLLADVRVPLADVTAVEVVADPLRLVRGLRSPGLAVPGRTRIGTWRQRHTRTVAVVRAGERAVRVRLTGAPSDRRPLRQLLVSVADAAAVAAAIDEAAVAAGSGVRAWREEPVTIRSGSVRLAGTLTRPRTGVSRGTALLLPGSGEVDRDGDHRRLPLGVSRELGRALAEAGVASLRYDKRGVGGSDGSWLATGLSDNLDDARAALAFLTDWAQARTNGTGRRPVLVGHSEGALLGVTLAAEASASVAGIVLLAGAAKTGEQTLAWQTRKIAATLPAAVRRILGLLRIDVVAKQRDAVAKVRATTTDVVRVQGRRINARWQRELLDFDPLPYLKRVRVPVLALTGAKDLQVDPTDVETIRASVPAPVTAAVVPDLTHLLRRDPSAPSVNAYKRLAAEPMDAEVLRTVTDWVAAHTGGVA